MRDVSGTTLKLCRVIVRNVGVADAIGDTRMRPVCIPAGALGRQFPKRTLYLSRQHRILVTSAIAERMFSTPNVLVAARHLLDMPRVDLAPVVGAFRYYHLLFERHGIVSAEGVACESFLIAPNSMQTLSRAARKLVIGAFPEARNPAFQAPSAALIPSAKAQKRLVKTHLRNDSALIKAIRWRAAGQPSAKTGRRVSAGPVQ